ncbi:MAG TPA: STAS domain-containing protein, partial [Acidimicrobiales bacterium]|nr:STAS domain-containing protein [Acidimicrobiales bacterium]
ANLIGPGRERNVMVKIETYPNGVVCLRPVGDLDWSNATALRHAVHSILRLHVRVELDLQDVESIDAAGLSALVGSVRLIRNIPGQVRVIHMPPAVRSRVELLRIDPRFVGMGETGEAA